jgi:hypothetical protein
MLVSVHDGVFICVKVIVPAPYWVSYVEMVRLAGATPIVVETTAEEGYMLTPVGRGPRHSQQSPHAHGRNIEWW